MTAHQIDVAFTQGIKLGPTISKDRYLCPETGAHFAFPDMLRRLVKVESDRMFDPRAAGYKRGP